MLRYGGLALGILVVLFSLLSGSGVDVSTPLSATPTGTRVAPPTFTPGPMPTPTLHPSVTATAPVTVKRPSLDGAAIWLRVKPGTTYLCNPATDWATLWTVVQWQDAAGDWHDVGGWRGPLDEVAKGEGRKVWWLPNHLRGAGPFRWQVYDYASGSLLVESGPFYLPEVGRRLKVEIVLP
jgi:hypothetical protein